MEEIDIRRGVADGMTDLFAINSRLADIAANVAAAHNRVRNLIDGHRAYLEAERRREAALAELEMGLDVNIADTLVEPTPELLAKGTFIRRKIAGEQWQDRTVEGVRRIEISQITLLHGRGVLTDDSFRACKWYKDRYLAAEMEPSAPVAQYGETVRGDPVYGHLPSSEWAAEARSDIRYARGFIPDDILPFFEEVICHDLTMKDAARVAHLRFVNFSAAFKIAADRLYDGVSSRLG